MSPDISRPRDFWKLFGVGLACLVISAWVLKARVKTIVLEDQSNRALLEQASAGFNERTIPQLTREIDRLQGRLYATSVLFNPEGRWLRKGYDVSILFVEELNNANEFLKREAAKMQVEFPEFSFSEKLPNENEAARLLTQLYGIREVLNEAIELGADVVDIKPLKIEEEEKAAPRQWVILPSHIELRFPHETITEFLLRITGIVPKISIDELDVKVQKEFVEVLLNFSTVYTGFDFSKKESARFSANGAPAESYPQGIESYLSVLRSITPFAVPERKEDAVSLEEAAPEKAVEEKKPAQRFFFRGRGSLHGKEVAVIEDTFRQETVFLTRGEQYEKFRLQDFSDDGAILESVDDGIITIINWEEQ